MAPFDEALLVDRLERFPEVLVAYLFGSRARGVDGPLSDVDIAVLLREGTDAHTAQLELMASLGKVVGSDRIDVVILNGAPHSIAYRILKDGRLLVCRDDRARVDHWAQTVDRYLDMEPMRRTLAEGLRHRLEESKFGRP